MFSVPSICLQKSSIISSLISKTVQSSSKNCSGDVESEESRLRIVQKKMKSSTLMSNHHVDVADGVLDHSYPLLKLKRSLLILILALVPIAPTHVYSINDSLSAEEAVAAEYEFIIRQLVINSSTNVGVIITGSSKAEVVHRAINNVEGPSLLAKMVQPTNEKLALVLDKLVASKLDGGAQFFE